MPVQRASTYLWRGSVRVRIPVPVEDAVVAMYGRNYDHPVGGWQWDLITKLFLTIAHNVSSMIPNKIMKTIFCSVTLQFVEPI